MRPSNPAQVISALATAASLLTNLRRGTKTSRRDWLTVRMMLVANLLIFAPTAHLGPTITTLIALNAAILTFALLRHRSRH